MRLPSSYIWQNLQTICYSLSNPIASPWAMGSNTILQLSLVVSIWTAFYSRFTQIGKHFYTKTPLYCPHLLSQLTHNGGPEWHTATYSDYEATYSSFPRAYIYFPSGPLAGRWTPLHRESQPVPPPLVQACHLLRLPVETPDVVMEVSQHSYTQSCQEELQRNVNIKATPCNDTILDINM